jgi:Fe-S cluster assembly scaffold protein SufB
MTVLPSLDMFSNNLIAKHTVNIGQINPEVIFYLNTKRLNKQQIYEFLINNFIKDIQPYLFKFKINISHSIKKILGVNNE